ncbi:hypothetical protein CC78DRAFT_571784 [Lojkania enalia]|uniref:Uncharacterized protein n=1 Tax=Lojkania enalia TaxID=147567 RepID=A0A9P4JZW8_9PLEO|nr:hypothetical protein CC78DRAFT_571784 [Didymosphaeria enalia]
MAPCTGATLRHVLPILAACSLASAAALPHPDTHRGLTHAILSLGVPPKVRDIIPTVSSDDDGTMRALSVGGEDDEDSGPLAFIDSIFKTLATEAWEFLRSLYPGDDSEGDSASGEREMGIPVATEMMTSPTTTVFGDSSEMVVVGLTTVVGTPYTTVLVIPTPAFLFSSSSSSTSEALLTTTTPDASIPESIISKISKLPISGSISSMPTFSILPYPPLSSGHWVNTTSSVMRTGSRVVRPFPTAVLTVKQNYTTVGTIGWPTAISSSTNGTITLKQTSTLLITKIVTPILGTGIGAIGTGPSNTPPALTTTARWQNSSIAVLTSLPSTATGTGTSSFSSLPSGYISTRNQTSRTISTIPGLPSSASLSFTLITTISNLESFPIITPSPTPIFTNTTSTSVAQPTGSLIPFTGRGTLAKLCSLSNISTITLPLLSLFYGPTSNPVLTPLPGCFPQTASLPSLSSTSPPSSSGPMLNCTLLGTEISTCQSHGHHILLTLRASPATLVAGNTLYGSPGSSDLPFGPYFPPTNTWDDASDSTSVNVERNPPPNLFDSEHSPAELALELFAIFGAALPPPQRGYENDRPLGPGVVLDGFDVQIPREWKGTWQGDRFLELAGRLRGLGGMFGGGEVLVGWV